jgi:hypothetical protein
LIVASFSMSHFRVSRAALSHAPSENQRVTGCRFRKLGPFDSQSAANQNMIAE